MADEPTIGELSRRLDGVQMTITHLVQRTEYAADQRLTERRFTELERDVAELARTLGDDVKAVRVALESAAEKRQLNARQMLYAGILPALFVLVGIAVQIWLAARSA